ncbi:Sec-independent protein translocase protein TatB [Oceanobacter sp. 4_MG-2023]|uniref:Sec-independent protein translocase protein TatB n=1 Tax=Oceanobacter sp. 4_MG-2023 TaxID=3062623 RepID=UPI0027376896|nr:Sec-independent protein translocase protein TatB [Oceanobacter sp. 4_MG-2023]MDP2547744.1 Sec-independent protein translocase protein TatB [Oceanobacter sp. 4_MG-2023]
MFDIGFLELVVVGVLGLLVLGPERLPKAARTVGLMIGRVRRTMSGFQDELERQVRADELREKLKDPYATFLDDDDRRPAAVRDSAKGTDHGQPPVAEPATAAATTARPAIDSREAVSPAAIDPEYPSGTGDQPRILPDIPTPPAKDIKPES